MNKKITLMTATEQDFFKRGREIAKAADLGQPIPEESIISFEDPADVAKLVEAWQSNVSDEANRSQKKPV